MNGAGACYHQPPESATGGRNMGMIAAERRAAAGLAAIYGLRMLGIFLALPVLAIAARDLSAATPVLIGLAIGIYGLTQALLQVPFGLLSDRLGRKRIILAGLLLFVAGSVLCALADSIWGVIVGRALQGAGAIAAALMALAADLSRDQMRTRVMAVIGVSIGLAFAAALVLGPLVNDWLGLSGLFWLTGGLGVVAIGLLYTVVPAPRMRQPQGEASPAGHQLRAVVTHPGLLHLDAGIFFLHCIMTASFVALPLSLEALGLRAGQHWQMYLPTLALSVILMVPLILLSERPGKGKPVFLIGIALVALGQLGLGGAGDTAWLLATTLLVFFTGFNLLEASLPARISRAAPAAHKGTAMGVYTTSQFLGAFVGGSLAGLVHNVFGLPAVFQASAGIAGLWLLLAVSMREPAASRSVLVRLEEGAGHDPDDLAMRLASVNGVHEAVVVAEEGVAYLKVDGQQFEPAAVNAFGLRVVN